MKFSIGYNHDPKLLDLMDVYKDNIESLYFPIPRQYSGSGRQIPQRNSYRNEIPEIIKKCTLLGIRSQLLLNATCDGRTGLEKAKFLKIIKYIETLRGLGLNSVVVTNPVYISGIKEQIKDIVVESSVNCYVKTVEQALYLKDLGADILTVDRDVNRNIPLIRSIKKRTGLKIKIMLNEGCLRNCPFRNVHYNYLSHYPSGPRLSSDNIFPDEHCIKIYLKNPGKFPIIPFIPPEALSRYAQIIDYYKLSTRTFSTAKIESCLKAYIEQDFNGNLKDILDSPGLIFFDYIDYGAFRRTDYINKMIRCNNDCDKCDYCNKLMKDAVVMNPAFMNDGIRNKEDLRALKIYKRILITSPENIPANMLLSRTYFRLDQPENAIEIANRVLELNPLETACYSLLSSHYERIKDYAGALKIYNKELKAYPESGAVCLRMGKAYFRLEKYTEAIKYIKKAITLNCTERKVFLLLGYCYEKTGHYKEAIEALRKEVKMNPGDARVNYLLSKCYKKIDKTAQSNVEMEKGHRNTRNFNQIYHKV